MRFLISISYQMRTVAMCLSFFQAPRCGLKNPTVSWVKNFSSPTHRNAYGSSYNLIISNVYNSLEKSGNTRRSSIRRVSTHNTEKGTLSSKTTSNINQYCDVTQNIAESKELIKPLTVIIFDLETTGYLKDGNHIIEIALKDLSGGEHSTFHTLVNPGTIITNTEIHGITNDMVRKPDVPRMHELIPILLDYVSSRRKPGGQIMFVAHNARTFDARFLAKEFKVNSAEMPPDWLFLDTLPLARELVKSKGPNVPLKASLQVLQEHYKIESTGPAHRAMSDVNTLSLVLQKLTVDLKLPISALLERSFTISDLNEPKNDKKKSSK